MEIVRKTKKGIYLRRHPKFGTLIFSPLSGLFLAVADNFSEDVERYCNNKTHDLPEKIINHLNIGNEKYKCASFDVENWLPSKEHFSDIDELPDEQPIVLNWLISNKCNCNCTYCYAGDVIDKEFAEVDVIKVAKELLDMNPLAIVLSGGEPLLEKSKLKDVLNTIGNRTGIMLDTNGLIYQQDIVPLLKKYNVVVRISLDSLLNSVNSKIRPQKDKKNNELGVQTIVKNILLYKEAGISILVHTVLSTMNKKHIEDLSIQLPLLNVNGWRIFTIVRPNDDAKKDSFDKLMKYGKVKTIEEAEKNIQKEMTYFERKFKSESHFHVQILQGSTTKHNSVILVMPDGKLMTEGMFKSAKTIIEKDSLFKKVDLRSHYERYFGII